MPERRAQRIDGDHDDDDGHDEADSDKRLSMVDEALVAGTIANTNGLLVILAKLVAKGVFDRADLKAFSDSYSKPLDHVGMRENELVSQMQDQMEATLAELMRFLSERGTSDGLTAFDPYHGTDPIELRLRSETCSDHGRSKEDGIELWLRSQWRRSVPLQPVHLQELQLLNARGRVSSRGCGPILKGASCLSTSRPRPWRRRAAAHVGAGDAALPDRLRDRRSRRA